MKEFAMTKEEVNTAFFLAKKNILKNFGSLSFTIILIALGFISSTIIYGALKDTQHDIQEDYIETSVGHVILEPYDDAPMIENVDSIMKKIHSVSEIIGSASVTKKSARLYDSNSKYIDSEVYIISPEDFSLVSKVDDIISDGTFLAKGEKNKIVMGCVNIKQCNSIEAFDRIDVSTGDNVRSIFDANHAVNLSLKGIYDHQFVQTELISYINQETAKEIFEDYDSNKADMILISLQSREYADQVVKELAALNIHTKILTWEHKTTKYSSIIDSFLIIGDLSFLIGVIISAISIYVVLYINIMNKKAQIGIIRAIGIRSRVISLSYVIVSLFLGIIGSLFGIILTLLMIEYFNINPIVTGIGELVPSVGWKTFFMVSISITLASVISGYFVSKKITKYNIIQAITNV